MDEEDKIIEDLILSGALEACGIDIDTGEPLYNFTEKLESVNPELHNEFFSYFHQDVMSLWSLGYIDMDVTDQNPIVKLTQKAVDKSEILKLDKGMQFSLKEIIRIMEQE
jgi:hypothetical protein